MFLQIKYFFCHSDENAPYWCDVNVEGWVNIVNYREGWDFQYCPFNLAGLQRAAIVSAYVPKNLYIAFEQILASKHIFCVLIVNFHIN